MELFFIELCPLDIQKSAFSSSLEISSNQTMPKDENQLENVIPSCIEQDSRLQLIFTVAMFVQSVTLFFSGILVDKYGPKLIRAIGL